MNIKSKDVIQYKHKLGETKASAYAMRDYSKKVTQCDWLKNRFNEHKTRLSE